MKHHIAELLEHAPSNWGRWGDEDELGAVNHLTPSEVLRGVAAVETGETYALGTPLGHPDGDPAAPGVEPVTHEMLIDKSHYQDGRADAAPDGLEWAGDRLELPVHGVTSHVDSPAHVWYDERLYNGFDAASTTDGLGRCGIEHVAEHSIVGRGILLDIARHRDVDYLGRDERITLEELQSCADAQGTKVEPHDMILLRTGVLELFYDEGPAAYEESFVEHTAGAAQLREPGPTYTDAFVEWVAEREIPMLATDTITAEQTVSEETGTNNPLHPALLRNLGVLLAELHYLPELAASCATDGRYEFLYVCSPLKIVGGTGSPVNPVAIR